MDKLDWNPRDANENRFYIPLDSASLAYVFNNHSKNNDNKKVLQFSI